MDIEKLEEVHCDCGATVWSNGDVDCDDEEGLVEHECEEEDCMDCGESPEDCVCELTEDEDD